MKIGTARFIGTTTYRIQVLDCQLGPDNAATTAVADVVIFGVATTQ